MTLRELYHAYYGKLEHDWSMASSIMAMIANAFRDSNQKPYQPVDFNPLSQNKKQPASATHDLRDLDMEFQRAVRK